jgi:hypothetical protein
MLSAVLLFTVIGAASVAAPVTVLPAEDTFEQLAEPPPPENLFETHPLSFELRFGVAAPTGALGVALEYSPIEEVGLGCGIGSNVLGWEPACWLRGRAPLARNRALTLSSGLSMSTYDQSYTTNEGLFDLFGGALAGMGEAPTRDLEFRRAYWSNTDLGYEARHKSFVFRAFIGAAILLNPSSGVAAVYPSDDKPAETPIAVLAYGGIGVGYAPGF